jgi:hypothetical protein
MMSLKGGIEMPGIDHQQGRFGIDKRACRLHRITQPCSFIRRDVAHCMAGGVNSADRLNLVIDSIRPDTHRGRSPTGLFLPTAQEGWLSADANLVYPLLGHRRR